MPTLTAEEIERLEAEKAKAENVRDTMSAAVPAKQARAAELAVADGAFKKFFDYYNDGIIGNYDSERKALDGQYIAEPISEDDIEGTASLDGNTRTTPTSPVTDIIRVPEFDGGPLITDDDNETQNISDQEGIEDVLVNGYGAGGGFNPATAQTATSLNSGSTTLNITDPTNSLSFAVNDVFVVIGFSDIAVVKVTSVTTPPGTPPPYQQNLGIELLVAPAGTISSGADLVEFTGFSNTERTNKIASNPDLQGLMDYLIGKLEDEINARISNLNNQLSALADNEDPDALSEISTATTNANTSKTFLLNYLITTIISNTGLASLASERTTRGAQVTSRLAEILAAYTGQTENYYDRRYTIANDRANTSRGTLRLQKATEAAADQLTSYAAGAQSAIDAINALLP